MHDIFVSLLPLTKYCVALSCLDSLLSRLSVKIALISDLNDFSLEFLGEMCRAELQKDAKKKNQNFEIFLERPLLKIREYASKSDFIFSINFFDIVFLSTTEHR